MDELRRASVKLKTNKAAGVDEVLGEFRRVIFDDRLHPISAWVQGSHRPTADYFLTDEGYLVIQSGGPSGSREWAGVGFLVAPAFRRSVLGVD